MDKTVFWAEFSKVNKIEFSQKREIEPPEHYDATYRTLGATQVDCVGVNEPCQKKSPCQKKMVFP